VNGFTSGWLEGIHAHAPKTRICASRIRRNSQYAACHLPKTYLNTCKRRPFNFSHLWKRIRFERGLQVLRNLV
jgi:hypothetical protein